MNETCPIVRPAIYFASAEGRILHGLSSGPNRRVSFITRVDSSRVSIAAN